MLLRPFEPTAILTGPMTHPCSNPSGGNAQQKRGIRQGFPFLAPLDRWVIEFGGRYKDRTCDPYHVKVVLYR